MMTLLFVAHMVLPSQKYCCVPGSWFSYWKAEASQSSRIRKAWEGSTYLCPQGVGKITGWALFVDVADEVNLVSATVSNAIAYNQEA